MLNRLAGLLLKVRRWVVQLAAFGLWNSLLFPGLKALPCPALNCYGCPFAVVACPIGTLQHFIVIREAPFYMLGVLGIIGALVGRISCGWLCPFGFLQDLLYKLKAPKLRLSNRFGWLRYAVLVVLVGLIPFFTLEPWFCKLCPTGTLEAGIPWLALRPDLRHLAGWLFWSKVGILVFFLAWMVFTRRPFCRFVCPLGAIYSLFNRFSALQLRVDESACARCDRCQEVCSMDIRVYENPQSGQCVRCLECVRACPKGAVRLAGAEE
ncbi:MAG: 4Fe-4S binding protein [Chloroflexi bacterium HGW-Chloroflexi-1]|nr:MAG: 4Fe-4S binding protein [Chloroflexi bacterium HGW-Chloroflexi-1]